MSDAINGLKPELLWKHFAEISKIPRCSKHEEKIRNYLKGLGKSRGHEVLEDVTGNVVIKLPAATGYEKAPTVILQAHMDMVCEKNKSTEFDFLTDPIRLVREGNKIKADGTTLGADNGIGLASALAVVDSKNIKHGPIEILATTDEETGLTGAFNLDPSVLSGQLMLNLDTEVFGYIYVGCAGGGNVDVNMPLVFKAPKEGYSGVSISLEGLKGGHSGTDIHKNRGNAIIMLARFLLAAKKELKIEVASLDGGDKHNAIPREAFAKLAISPKRVKKFKKLAQHFEAKCNTELEEGHQLKLVINDTELPAKVWKPTVAEKTLSVIVAIPVGPVSMSNQLKDLVQTSNNLAVCRTLENEIYLQNSPRSSLEAQLENVIQQIEIIAELGGGTAKGHVGYPGWQPDMNSKLLSTAKGVSKELFGKEFEVTAIHAGLECGIIGAKIPGLDKISFGPDIDDAHSPNESVNVESIEKFFTLLTALLERIATKGL